MDCYYIPEGGMHLVLGLPKPTLVEQSLRFTAVPFREINKVCKVWIFRETHRPTPTPLVFGSLNFFWTASSTPLDLNLLLFITSIYFAEYGLEFSKIRFWQLGHARHNR